MASLRSKKCIPCELGGEPLGNAEAELFMKELKGWHFIDVGKKHEKIAKNLAFLDFKRAVGFLNEIADLAEFEGHHPDLNLHDWNKLDISLSTHSMNGLSENDFIVASKIDQILEDNRT